MLKSSIDEELKLIESVPTLHSLIPQFLFDYFNKDFNETILKNLIGQLDHLLESVDANNSFRILTINDDTLNRSTLHTTNLSTISSSNSQSSSILINACKSLLLDITIRVGALFQTYSDRINEHIDRFEQYSAKFGSLKFASGNDILLYQRANLVERFASRHYNLFNMLFKNVFDIYQRMSSQNEDEECENESDTVYDNSLLEHFHQINRVLFDLALFDHLCGDVVVEVVEIKIQQHIESISMDNYEESFIEPFEKWLDKIIIGWIELIYSFSESNHGHSKYNQRLQQQQFSVYLASYKKQLAHFMYTHYSHTRIKRLFDIVIDYPDSKPALDDLKLCLSKTQLRSHVVKSLRSSIEQRLLHPGVNTSDILTAYVSAIKALLCLDPSGVMMENICEPLKKYLRLREDTIKCIVSNLTDDPESSNDLMEEFCKDLYSTEGNGSDVIDSATAQIVSSSFVAAKSWLQWQPDPVDSITIVANADSAGSKSNIISMLVNIYGSKDLFVNEYKSLLADRLLTNYATLSTSSTNSKIETEIRNLELLKLRFGEGSLFSCEAMLKDIAESRRINANILEQLVKKDVKHIGEFEVNAQSLKSLVLSEQFWPKLKEEKIELPDELKLIQEKYVESFEAFKGNRTLIWKNNLGQVNLEIEINGQKVAYSVSPIHAAVILKFQEQEEWSLSELAHSLKMCSFALRKKLSFWKAQCLICEKPNSIKKDEAKQSTDVSDEIYCVVKENSGKLCRSGRVINELEMDEQEEAKGEDEGKTSRKSDCLKEPELTLYWNFTQSMLRNVGCLPLERIHAWLKRYANADITIEQAKYLCEFKIKEQLLKMSGGLYRLNK